MHPTKQVCLLTLFALITVSCARRISPSVGEEEYEVYSTWMSGSRNAIRLITFFNFFVFALFVIPSAHRWIDRIFLALRSYHFERPVGLSLQIWLPLSTLVATILLARMMWQRRRSISAGLPSASLKLETTLVTAWWLAILGACAYAFMIGMGG